MLALDEKAAPGVCAVASLKLDELKDWLTQEIKSIKDESQKAHFFHTI